MSNRHHLVSLLLISVFASACATTKDEEPLRCGRHELKFKLDNGCVKKVLRKDGTDGEDVIVRTCETVEWHVGLFKSQKSIAFDKGDGSPFSWTDSGYKGGKIEGTVTVTPSVRTEYRYTVRTKGKPNGCPHDPMIIVQP